MDVSSFFVSGLAGALGGCVFAVKGFLKARKDNNESFDGKKFFGSLIVPIVFGFAAGALVENDFRSSFEAGLFGKWLNEVGSDLSG